MMDYNPSKWRSTRRTTGYVYSMKYDSAVTLKHLSKTGSRIRDRRFFHQPSIWHGKRVYGWVSLDRPMQLFDAMEAGLVPMFREPPKGERF